MHTNEQTNECASEIESEYDVLQYSVDQNLSSPSRLTSRSWPLKASIRVKVLTDNLSNDEPPVWSLPLILLSFDQEIYGPLSQNLAASSSSSS